MVIVEGNCREPLAAWKILTLEEINKLLITDKKLRCMKIMKSLPCTDRLVRNQKPLEKTSLNARSARMAR